MKHKSVKMVISLTISLLLVLQIIPMNVFAALYTENMNVNVSEIENDEVPNVVAEVVEERAEFSKVYLLEDGSYYSITTYAPIHEMKNGKWEDIETSNVDVDNVVSINDAQSMLQTISAEQFENNVDIISEVNTLQNSTNETDSSSLVHNIINGEENNGIISLSGWGAFVAKPTSLHNYTNRNKLIINAYVNAECICSDFHYSSEVSVYEMTDFWNETSDLSSYEFEDEPLIDTKVIETSGSGNYSWDITDVYSKWDKGVKANNGFILGTTSIDCEISLSSVCISVIYRDIDESDALSTYHTVDMGRAGSIYINDLTNTVKLEQDILKIPRTVMPIYLKRIYNLSDVFDSESSGFRWNYESSLILKDGLVSWKTFDGTVKHFVQSDPSIVSGEYTQWCLVDSESSTNPKDTSLWIKTDEISNSIYDYSNFYIISNNIKYDFNSSGKMILMGIRNDENNSISFNYTEEILTSISYINSDIFTSIQISKINNIKTIVQITSNNLVTNEVSYNEIVSIETSTEDYITKNKVTYNDGKSVEYEFDSEQKLTSVTDEDGTKLQLIFYDDSAVGDRLLCYQKSSEATEYYEDMYFFDDETYRRYYLNSNSTNQEMIQYDKDFRVVSHQDSNGNYTFASYDENGIVDSFVVSGDVGTEKLLFGSFEDENNNKKWGVRGNVSWIDYESKNVTLLENGENKAVYLSPKDKTAEATTLSQRVKDLSADTTYVFGAWIYVDKALATGDITISTTSAVSGESFEVEFDPTVVGCWQYNLMACKFSDVSNVKFNVILKNQVADVYVDNATLYEATSASVDLLDTISVSPFEIVKNTDGSVDKEVITDGITSLMRSYTYNENKISSITDMNGITTYYGYNSDTGTLNEIGTIKDNNGNIINPTELVSTINGLPTYIKQNVTNISTNQNIEMTATYTYDADERVSSITHNGITYNYQYDSGNLIKISKNDLALMEYEFTNEGVGQILYCNGATINYSYENGIISEVEINKNNDIYKKYVYYYDVDNDIDYIVETTDNIKIDYLNDGFEIYSLSNSSAIPIYKYIESSDGFITEKYYPDVFSDKSDNLKDKNSVVKTTSKSEKYVDVNTGETTKTSTQSINKINDWNSETDYNESVYTLNKSSVADYFGRIAEKFTEINSSVNDSQIRVSEKYVYKDLSTTTTSTTVSSHTSRIDVLDSNSEAINIVNEKTYYEYDEAGNIVFEYQVDNNNVVPINYYEYDEANQLVGEYNVKKNLCSTYTYDNGGNITEKIYHDVSTVICNSDIHKVENYGTVVNSVTYSYNVNSKDLLTNYNGTDISYDSFGNPLNYLGKTYETTVPDVSTSSVYNREYSVSGTCEWTGKYLTAFETESNRFTYDYNEDGYRIKKTVMDKDENGSFNTVKEIIYIWNNNKLSGIIYRNINTNSDETTSITSAQADIIYDQEGEAVGFVFSDELEWYFVKDLNGSVSGIVSSGGTKIATITYDAWGLPSICFNVDVATELGKAQYAILSLTVPFNPISYKGYLYDYETGLYFSQDKVYSPSWGRYLNPVDYEDKSNPTYSTTSINMYSFCNNNPVNVFDPYSYASTIRVSEFSSVSEVASGFDIQMNEAFLSRVFCGVFANSIIKKFGIWEYSNGSTAYGMDAEYIAKNLFAHNIAKYRLTALNAVNASWGDGWASQVALKDSIKVYKNDIHKSNYEMIWNAGYIILQYI